MTQWQIADAALVRARLATAYLEAVEVPATIGRISLRPHQRDAATRLRVTLERFGGALLADDVGLGKTYTALAATATLGRLVVVTPASLATMWREALINTGREADVVSFESLSRKRPALSDSSSGRPTERRAHDVVIVDEAHHARNPATRRYANLSALTVGARVLLLSATPVHNAAGDLHALLALFIGTQAEQMSPHDLGVYVVRRTRADVPATTTPARAPPVWLDTPVDSDVLAAIVRIPPSCPPSDGSDASALVTLGLVRAWSSTDAALRSALRRRLARADSLRDALLAGRYPTRAELIAWVIGDDATQLAFPELVATEAGTVSADLLASVAAHADGVSSALRLLARSDGRADDARRDLIRTIRARHRGLAVVVFSQYAESVQAMYKRLVGDGRVCAVTAAGSVVAGGTLSRGEALARFAPDAAGRRSPSPAEAIDVLIATDLLSEGLNLQDAAVVVHVDLPWTPARLMQRLGRVWRIGSRHPRVFEYVIAPPAAGERVSAIIERLRRKAAESRITVGCDLTSIEPRDRGDRVDSAGVTEAIRAALVSWRRSAIGKLRTASALADSTASGPPHTVVAVVESAVDGWLALISDAGAMSLVGRCGDGIVTMNPRTILDLVSAANGPSISGCETSIDRTRCEIADHLTSSAAAHDAGLAELGSEVHRRLASRIAAVVSTAPPHRQPIVARLASAARAAVRDIRGSGGEEILSSLLVGLDSNAMPDTRETWLSRVVEVAGRVATPRPVPARDAEPHVPAVLILTSAK